MKELLLIIIAYLVGSIPTAVWVSKVFFGVDIRHYGSGNSGATNTYRVLGAKWGTFVMVVDMLKGLLASFLYLLLPYYLTDEFQRTNFMVGRCFYPHYIPIDAAKPGSSDPGQTLKTPPRRR